MRHIGNLPDEPQALRFEDFLLTLDIKAKVEPEEDAWAVWIIEEDDVERSREELALFADDPEAEQYRTAKSRAEERRREELKQLAEYRRQQVNVRDGWQRPMYARMPLTTLLTTLCVVVAIATSSFEGIWQLCDNKEPYLTHLFIAPVFDVPGDKNKVSYSKFEQLQNVRSGELHRLVTPIFIHFTIMHLLFNLLALRAFGGTIELKIGSWKLLWMVLFIAAVSNFGQFLWTRSPAFGGISGVDFGLFGFIWMKSQYDPQSGFLITPMTIFMGIGWLFLCYAGAMGSIANAAHTIGLIAGMLLGLWPVIRRQLFPR